MRIRLVVNSIIFIVSLLLLLKASLWDINWLKYESPIEYKNYKEISLKDFKGLNRAYYSLDGMKEFAFIVTEIKTFKKDNKYYVVTLFHPSRSYTFKNEFELDYKLLRHEIYHFHLKEYYARLLRKEIISNKHIDEDIIKYLRNDICDKEELMQQFYDDETYHGYVLNKQLSWQNTIDSLLNSVAKYKETEININN